MAINSSCALRVMLAEATLKQLSWKRGGFRRLQKHWMATKPTACFYSVRQPCLPSNKTRFLSLLHKVWTVFPPLVVLAPSEGQRGQQ